MKRTAGSLPAGPTVAPHRGGRIVLAGLALVAAALAPWPAQAQSPALPASAPAARQAAPLAADPALEARVLSVAEELRCLVCQNETIAASHADLAVDLRAQIRIQLREGQSERQILDFMTERYGDFVLYRPPVKPATLLLWLGPFVLLLVAGFALARHIRRRRLSLPTGALSPAQAERARQLLDPSSAPAAPSSPDAP